MAAKTGSSYISGTTTTIASKFNSNDKFAIFEDDELD